MHFPTIDLNFCGLHVNHLTGNWAGALAQLFNFSGLSEPYGQMPTTTSSLLYKRILKGTKKKDKSADNNHHLHLLPHQQ